MKKIEKLCSKAIQKAISKERDTWPPGCYAILYQPERPVQKARQLHKRERNSSILPSYCGDVETELIARANPDYTVTYFTVRVTSLGSSTVRVWAENQFGYNFSGPYEKTISTGIYNCTYNIEVPEKGDVVKMNMDNPVYTSAKPKIAGTWTPN